MLCEDIPMESSMISWIEPALKRNSVDEFLDGGWLCASSDEDEHQTVERRGVKS